MFVVYLHQQIKKETMVRTTSLKHYKELKAKGVNVQLVTKEDLNK
jgi:hypothetical protein